MPKADSICDFLMPLLIEHLLDKACYAYLSQLTSILQYMTEVQIGCSSH